MATTQLAQLQIVVTTQTSAAQSGLTALNTQLGTTAANAAKPGQAQQAAGAAGQQAWQRNAQAVGIFNTALQQSGLPLGPLGTAINGLTGVVQNLGNVGSATGKALLGIGAAAAVIGGVSIGPAKDLSEGMARAKTAVENTHHSFSELHPELIKANSHMERLGYTNAETEKAFARLTIGFRDPQRALHELALTASMARLNNKSLEASATDVVRILAGNYNRGLAGLGIDSKAATSAQKDLEKAIKAQEKAAEGAAKAHQRYEDHLSIQAEKARNLIPVHHDHAAALDRVARAQEHVADVAARQAAHGDRGAEQEVRGLQTLQRAHERVIEAVGREHRTRQGAIVGQDAARHAMERYNDLAAKAPHNAVAFVAAQQAQRHASEDVARAQEAYNRTLEDHAKHADHSVAAGIAERNARDALTSALDKEKTTTAALDTAKQNAVKHALEGGDKESAVNARIQGLAEERAHSFAGQMDRIKAKLTDMTAHFGEHAGKMLTVAGPALAGIGGLVEARVLPGIGKLVTGLGKLAIEGVKSIVTFATEGSVSLLGFEVAAGPLLIAIAALAAAAYLIYNNWDKIWPKIKEIAEKVWDTIKEVFGKIVEFIKKWGIDILLLLTPATWIIEVIRHWDAIKKAIGAALTWMKDELGKVKDWVLEKFADIGSWLLNAGKDLIEGFWHGIERLGGWLKDKIGKFFEDSVPGVIKNVFKALSPSRVAAEIGGHFVEGFMIGVDRKGPQLKHTMRKMAQSAIDATKTSTGIGTDGITGGEGLSNTLGATGTTGQAQTVIVQNFYVQGTIIDSQNLLRASRRGIVEAGRKNGGRYFAGRA